MCLRRVRTLLSEREFLQMSVRGLYKYVIEVITTPSKVPNIASVTEAGGNMTEATVDSSKDGDADDVPKENRSGDDDSQSREEITYRDRLGTQKCKEPML